MYKLTEFLGRLADIVAILNSLRRRLFLVLQFLLHAPQFISARTSPFAPPIIIVNNQPSVSFTPNIDHHRQGQPLTAEVAALSDRSSVKSDAREIPQIVCPKDRLFRTQTGPTGVRKRYQRNKISEVNVSQCLKSVLPSEHLLDINVLMKLFDYNLSSL